MNDNPLAKHFRQPKLYIQFPSKGNFYPDGSLEETETGDYPIFAMTAKDELTIKTPDALLNGQATVSVIQSCVPNIKNAWHVPSIDVDAILIAIRIATYGEKMDLTFREESDQFVGHFNFASFQRAKLRFSSKYLKYRSLTLFAS